MEIAQIVFDDFTDIDVFLAWDLFHRVRDRDLKVRLLGTMPFHTSRSGLRIAMHGTIDEARHADAVVFASGPRAAALAEDPAYLARFALDSRTQRIGAMCSGALLLAALGLLDGKRATTYPTTAAALAARGVAVVDEPFVAVGNVATAAACLAGVDLAGFIIESLFDADVRRKALAEVAPVSPRSALLERLASTPRALSSLLERIPPGAHALRPAPGRFSPREHVHHLHDLDEQAQAERLEVLLEGQATTLRDFDGARVAVEGRYGERPHEAALASFGLRRAALLARVRAAPDEAWQRVAVHETLGTIDLMGLLERWWTHDEEHLGELGAIAGTGP